MTKLSYIFLKKKLNNMGRIVLQNEVFTPFCPDRKYLYTEFCEKKMWEKTAFRIRPNISRE